MATPAQPSPTPPSENPEPSATAELAVSGMHCGSCVALVQESLVEQVGVTEASVDLESGRAVVRYDPSVTGVDHLRATVADAGYSATPVG